MYETLKLMPEATKYGMGRHVDQQPPEWRAPYGVADLIASLAYSTSAMFVKLSILALYLKLSPDQTFRLLTFCVIFISASFGVSSVLAIGLQCIPISMLWDPNTQGHCIKILTFLLRQRCASYVHGDSDICSSFEIILESPSPFQTKAWTIRFNVDRCGVGLRVPFGFYCVTISDNSFVTSLLVICTYRITTIKDLLNSKDLTCMYSILFSIPPLAIIC